MAEQVFRIEIPIQAIDLTDKGALDKIDETLSKILKGVEKLKSSSASATDGLADGAKSAAAGLKEAGKAADDAGKQTDAFEKRVQKSNKTLRGMFKEKFQLIMQAIDRASPILKQIGASAKSLVSKAWRITVTLFDKVTAPFRSLYRMITSPISIALSIAGIGLGAKDTIGGFIDFQQGMSAVRALTGATNEEFKRLNQTAKDLGASTVFSASEVSQGMQYLGQSGWQVNEVISAMPGLLDMAAAGGADLATASDIVATVMRAMKIEAKDASRVADIFAKTATSSATNIEMMGETLKYAAPIAQGFGLSLEEVAALTGQMANAGIKGSMAGTAIRSSLLSMATPTKQAAKLMNDLNLSFSNSDGTMKGMSTIVRDLQTSFSTLTKEQRLNAAETLFGTYASSAWLGVIEQGADSYEAFQKSLEGSAGAAADMAKIRLDNLAGDIEELSGAFETLQFELMEKLNPYFRQFIQWFTGKMPMIQEKVLAFTDKAIEGIKRVSKHIGDVFASDDFKNADGFAAKFFVAWDKIIAEPMQKWWDGGGKTKVLAIVERIAKTAGEMLRGIATGIIAAFTGQEIDFEGLNITGMAKAGAEAAKTFVSTFFKSLDLSAIAKKIPSIIGALMRDAGGMLTGNASGTGLISAFLLGKGALSLGGGIFRSIKLFGGLKTALFGVSATAKAAGAATATVATAATTAGAAKSVGVFAGIKGALSAIPGWGWAAAAALTAVGIGLKLHNDARERHRQELMTDSEKGAEAWQNYQKAATQAVEATNTIARIKEVKLKISRGGLTDAEIINIKALLTDLTKADPTIDIIPKLKRAGLTEAEITELRTNLTTYGLTAEVEAKLKSYGLTDTEIASLRTRLAAYTDFEVEVEAKLKSYGLSETDITGLRTNLRNTNDLTLEISTTLKKGTNWTQAQIDTFITDITGAEGRKIQLDLLLQGASLGEGALTQVQADLDATKIKIASVDTSTLEGLAEWQALKEKEVMLTLLLQGGNLTPEQVTQLSREYVAIETKTAVLTAELKKQGYTDKDIQEIVTLSQMAGQNNLVFNVAVQGISADQLANYNKELETLYGHLVGPSGGVITQEDIEAGNVTDERVAQAEAAIQANEAAKLANLQEEVFKGQATVPEQIKMRETYKQDYENVKSAQDTASTARANLASIRSDVAQWIAQDSAQYARTELSPGHKNYLSYDDYLTWSDANNINKDGAIYDRIVNEVGKYAMVNPDGIMAAMGLGGQGAGAFDATLQDLLNQETELKKRAEERLAVYEQQNANLVGQYTNEKNLVAGETFQGSNLQGKSIEDAAAVFSSLDTTGTQLFMDALNKLNDLNAQTNYITPAEKTNPQQMAQIAESSMLVAEAKQRISTVQAATPFGTSEEDMKAQAQAVSDVNKALDAMNLDKISSYTQIGEALKSIEEVDISKVDTTALHSALETLGGVSSGTQAKIDALRDAVAQLDGKTATVTVTTNYQTNGEAPPQGQLPKNAMGGIYDGAFLSWVAEDGPEAIIPLSAKRRNRGLDLWLAAGRALGVGQFAEGGIVAPYAGLLSQIGDSEEAEGRASAYAPAPQKAGVTVSVSVNSNPVFQIESENPEGVMDKIRANIKEIVDMLGSQMAAELEDILSNMPA